MLLVMQRLASPEQQPVCHVCQSCSHVNTTHSSFLCTTWLCSHTVSHPLQARCGPLSILQLHKLHQVLQTLPPTQFAAV